MPNTAVERSTFADMMAIVGGLIAAAVGIYVATQTHDNAMAFHAILLAAAAGLWIGWVFNTGFSKTEQAPTNDYMDGPIKVCTIAAIFWGIAGFLVGDILAWQLALPMLNFDLPWISFGRLRPLHTSAVIFAFGGNVLLATSFYVVQRTSHARLSGRWSPWFIAYGYQLFIAVRSEERRVGKECA